MIEKGLKALCRLIDGELAPGAQSRGMVDYGPAMERVWAARANLGFAGKHTLLIDPERGSFFFLAVILTTADFEPTSHPAITKGCGDCRRCIDACPTGAITEPWRFDARRCLSYLTIETEGPVSADKWADYAGYLFGCDICQEVCPYNQSRAVPVGESSAFAHPLVPGAVPLHTLLRDAESFIAGLTAASPLKRAGAEGLRRNAIIVAATHGTAEDHAVLRELAQDAAQPDWIRNMAAEAMGAE